MKRKARPVAIRASEETHFNMMDLPLPERHDLILTDVEKGVKAWNFTQHQDNKENETEQCEKNKITFPVEFLRCLNRAVRFKAQIEVVGEKS